MSETTPRTARRLGRLIRGMLRTPQVPSHGERLAPPRVVRAVVPGLPPFDFEIHTREDRYVSADLAATHIWEPFETEIVRRLCRPGDFVMDIGGNIGWYSVLMAQLIGPTGRLMTFEPDPDNFEMLKRNIARCTAGPRPELFREAVGDEPGAVRLFLSDTNLGDHRTFDDGTGRASIETPQRSLESILAGESRLPDLVKSDTQGAEGRIVKGARRLFASGWRPILLIEFWPYGLDGSGGDAISLWNELADLGYVAYEVTERRPRLYALPPERVRLLLSTEIDVASEGFINILALPEHSDRVELGARPDRLSARPASVSRRHRGRARPDHHRGRLMHTSRLSDLPAT